MSENADPDVIVVGAGPVGLSAALALAHRGVRVRVLEAHSAPNQLAHASTFHAPTLEILDEEGLGAALVARGRPAHTVQFLDREYGPLADVDFGLLRDETCYPFRLQVDQREMGEIVFARLRELPGVEFSFDTTVDALDQDDAGVVVRAGSTRHRAPWVLAADGAGSVMRSACGVEFPGSTYELRYLTVMTTLELDTVLPGIAPVTYVSGGPDGVGLIALRDHWRVAFRVPAGETREEALDPGRIQMRLRAAVSDKVDRYPVSGSFIYFIHRRVASSFRAGRVLLAGDAAHVNSPSGGMGMNSGIHDAFAFARVLAQVIRDELPAAALDEVATERRRVARDVIGARSEQNYQDIVDTDADRRAARRRELANLGTDDDAAIAYLMRASMLDHAPRPAR